MGRDPLKVWRKYYTCDVTGERKFVFMKGDKTFLASIVLDKGK